MTSSDRRLCDFLLPPDHRDDAVSSDAFEITYCETDLNSDGINELIAWESSWAGTSGGQLWILGKTRSGYNKIFETEMTWSPIVLLPTTHFGWRDVAFLRNGGGVDTTLMAVVHDRKAYMISGGTDITAEKPAGQILIGGNWSPSVFGPISPNP